MDQSATPVWKSVVKSVTPPLIWRAGASVVHALTLRSARPLKPGEQDALFYDNVYQESIEYRKHYTASPYYFLWCVIGDRLKRGGGRSVLDIGCGPGQFASMLRDAGVPNYCGLDLSEQAIQMARAICPEYRFVAESVFDSVLLDRCDYDTVVSTEFLEHVHEDVAVLNRIRAGTRFYGTVPNFPFVSHVRHFRNCEEVGERYGSAFAHLTVDAMPADNTGKRFYLIEGVKT